jgi:branched-chain amino acid aminotransferase
MLRKNVFLVHDLVLYTLPLATSILPGTHATSVLTSPRSAIPVKKTLTLNVFTSLKVFFCGTAVEITPIRSVDKIQVGKGVAGPITRKLQEEFFALTSGNKPDRHNWLTPVNAPVAAVSR